jgi:large subunit ribosomal protein L4
MQIKSYQGGSVGKVELDERPFFDKRERDQVLYRTLKDAIVMFQANQRQGTVNTRGRAEVVGSNRKPWRQKHTGRARAGDRKSPIWRGGGTVFGPKPRDYSYAMNKKSRKAALRGALSVRATENKLIVLDAFPVAGGKTKTVLAALKAVGASTKSVKALIVDVKDNELLIRGTRNLETSKWLAPEGLNVYDVLKYDHLVMTQASAKLVEQALRP